MRFQRPLDSGVQSSAFGPREGGDHKGVDWSAPAGAPVHVAGSGTVIQSDYSPSYGNLVVVDHGDGWTTRYAHMQGPGALVGTQVEEGDSIGKVGSTGRSTGNHLHFETRKDGVAYDPTLFLDGRPGTIPPAASPGVAPPSSGQPPSGIPPDEIENVQPTDVKPTWGPLDFYQSHCNKDDTPATFLAAPFIIPANPYYAAAELIVSDEVICPLIPTGRNQSSLIEAPSKDADNQSTRGKDLRLVEFQHREIVQGGAVSLFRLYLKSWTDIVQLADLCSGAALAKYRWGYTNLRDPQGKEIGIRDWHEAVVISFQPEFLQNGYYVSIELHDRSSFLNNKKGAVKATWRVIGGRISDLVIDICKRNNWQCCVEPTVPLKEHTEWQQKDQTDLNFIIQELGPKAVSAVGRPWVTDGGQGAYKAFFVDNVLHFHPLCPDPNSAAATLRREYVWGGIYQPAEKHMVGTVTDFKPDFNPQMFQVLGAGRTRSVSPNPVTKEFNASEGIGSDVIDNIMGSNNRSSTRSGGVTITHEASNLKRSRATSSPHRDSEMLRAEVGNKFFTFRDLCFAGDLTVVGDPYIRANMMISVKTVRPDTGILMFYDWLVNQVIHTIVGGQFTTNMKLTRYRIMSPRSEDRKIPGMGAGMGVWEQDKVDVLVKPLAVGTNFEKYGTQ
jgi:hypothetical protein